jgi:hypothetical protein
MFELYQVGLAFISLLIGLVIWAGVTWSKRSKSQGGLLPVPSWIEFSDQGSSGFYVATTFAGRPLERVSAHGLGFAGRANIAISEQGVSISRVGERSFLIDKKSLLDLARTSGVIDKVVEKDGLLSLRWKLGDSEIESHFRFANAFSRDEVASKISNLLVGSKW